MRNILLAVCILAATGTLHSQTLPGNQACPSGMCGSPVFSNPTIISQAISNTEKLHPNTYRLMKERAKETVSAVTQDTLGTTQQFFVYNFVSQSFQTVNAVLMAKGNLTEIWVDKTELADGHVDDSVVASIENALENQTPQGSKDPREGIVKLEESYFGMPPNSGNSNGYVHFLITDIKDGWDSTKNSSFIAGFFLSNDQPDPNTHQYNYGSNRRDMLYIDSYPGIYYHGARNPSAPLPTLAHEFQHLIHWHYDPGEVTFLNEGCSTNAEVVCGYPMRSPALYFKNPNIPLFTWRSNTDPNVLADYSRATIFMRYLLEQFGDLFAKDFVQNPAEGINGINSTLAEVGSSLNFNQVFQNWVIANALDDVSIGRQYGYSYPIAVRPTPSQTFGDPNVCLAQDTTASMAVNYLDFPTGDSLIVSYSSSGLNISAVESGTQSNVKYLSSSETFYEPHFGSTYMDVTLVLLNLASAWSGNISLTSSGKVNFIEKEISYDRGAPDTLGGATFLGFPRNSIGSGWAVQFTPASSSNQLVRAEIYAAFTQEFTNSTVPSSAPKEFLFHVWSDNNGLPGQDLITPFVVQVNRSSFDEAFTDIDLTAYRNQLLNLSVNRGRTSPVYIGFTDEDTLSTSVGLNHQTSTNYTFGYSQSRFGGWTPMSDLSIHISNGQTLQLAGWNLMMRAVFDYPTIPSPPPLLTVGITQNPTYSAQLSVVCIGDSSLRQESICGTLAQSSSTTRLSFSQISPNEFVSLNGILQDGGTASITIKAAKLFGSNYADTTLVFNSVLAGGSAATSLFSPDSVFRLTIPQTTAPFFATLYKGTLDTVDSRAMYVYSLGPKAMTISPAAQIQLSSTAFDTSQYAPAIYKDSPKDPVEKWYGIPFSFKNGNLISSTAYFSTFAVVPRTIISGSLNQNIPTSFALYQNYPNPFNPSTAISYQLSAVSFVTLKVYDMLGREVATLANQRQNAGSYTVTFDAGKLPSGVYFYRLTAGSMTETKKMVLIK